ncbi:TetR family transcriptional regulator [Paractinoplanes ferrugineus]|uniref:TetR family transcriptional regulator n=1 Tax=Paractinoplanes ferrugineus TaxID=113564 RepID=A0A919M8V0_9ACTN|nr:TetR family transcriptional regulator [Actinoplanes ferrugineus]GIE10861.1 TetR family transcriptional regulator [Actinoplanes ferrugineus]
MGRVSQAQAQENRGRIVETAARLFRERGVDGVSVADVMAEVGLTHGGFYKQFASKDALVAEAVDRAFADTRERLAGTERAAFVDWYLSAAHRDDPGAGCPAAGFGGDMAREDASSAALTAYASGIDLYARWLGDDLAAVSTLVGAMTIARATAGTELSDRVLQAAKAALSDG